VVGIKMLDLKEAEEVFRELSDIVREVGLDWLITDVRRQISLGKQGTRDIQVEATLRSPHAEYLPKRKGRKAEFIVTQPLTERERLHLLIEALEAASVGLSLGIVNCYETIGGGIQDLQSLGFAADTEGSEVVHVTHDILMRKESVVKLQILLRELKEAV
jgi:hypothetical protein